MPASTNLDFATLLAPLMRTAAGMTETAVRTQLVAILDDWAQGDAAFNRANAKVIQAIDDGDLIRTEFADWKAGAADGGPGGDGLFPMTRPDGTVEMVPGLAKLMADQAAAVAALSASGAVLASTDYNFDATAAKAAEGTAAAAMGSWLRRIQDLDLPPPGPRRRGSYARLFDALVRTGVWAKLDAFYLLAGHNQSASLINVRNPGTGDLLVNGVGLTWSADAGWKGGDPSDTGYLNTAYPGTALQDDASLGVWIGEAATRGVHLTSGAGRLGYSTTTDTLARINDGSSFNIPGVTGFFGASRTGANARSGQGNRGAPVSDTTASAGAATVLRLLATGAGTSVSDARLKSAQAGKALSVGQTRAAHVSLRNHFRDIARIANG